MTDKYKDLRDALAAGPTPGPWTACGSAGYVQAGEGHPRHTILAVAYGHDGNHQINAPGSRENGQYIAAANPETIRALMAERDGHLEQHGRDSKTLREYAQQRDDLRKERDALRASITEYLQAQDDVDNNEYQSMPEEFGKLNRRRRAARDDLDAALAQHQGEKHGDQ